MEEHGLSVVLHGYVEVQDSFEMLSLLKDVAYYGVVVESGKTVNIEPVVTRSSTSAKPAATISALKVL